MNETAPEFEVREDPQDTPLAWAIEGSPVTGTIRDLAKTIEYATHAGENYPTAVYAVTTGGELARVAIEGGREDFGPDDYADGIVMVVLNGRRISASYRIDGRC